MKLKKLTAVVVVVIAIGLSVLGCNPLPDSSSLNSSSNSSSEKVDLPVASEELRELRGYVSLIKYIKSADITRLSALFVCFFILSIC